MDNFDIFYELEPLFEGDEWDHRKTSSDKIYKDDNTQSCMDEQKEEKTTNDEDNQKIVTQEDGAQVQEGDEWDHRNTSRDNIYKDDDAQSFMDEQKEEKATNDEDDRKMVIQEDGAQVQKGDEWDHRKTSTEKIYKDYDVRSYMNEKKEEKQVNDEDDRIMITQEDGAQVQKGDKIHKNDDDQFCMNDQKQAKETTEEDDQEMIIQENCSEVEVSETDSKSTDESLVKRRTNPTRSHKRAANPPQKPIRENLKETQCKRKRINAKDFILPGGWTTEVRVMNNGSSSGNKDKYDAEISTGKVEVSEYLQSKQTEEAKFNKSEIEVK